MLETLERQLLNTEVRRSADTLDTLIADDFMEFGASGRRWTKADVLRALPEVQAGGAVHVSELSVKRLGDEHALVTYELMENGRAGPRTLRSSLWRRSGASWQIVFHQGTRLD